MKKLKLVDIILILSISILIGALFSCTPYRYLNNHKDEICATCITENTIDTLIVETTHTDTLWTIDSLIDSSYTELFLECDSNNNVLLTKINKVSGTNKTVSKYVLQNNVLSVLNRTYIDSIQVLNLKVNKLKNSVQIIEKPVVQEKKPLILKIIYSIIVILGVVALIIFLKIIK